LPSTDPLLAQPAPISSPTLTQRFQCHDPAALQELYNLYGGSIYSLIVRIVRDSSLAEDLRQETFLCAWRRASLFHPERGAVATWLLTIARNRAVDHWRSPHGRLNRAELKLENTEDPRLFTYIEGTVSIWHRSRLGSALQKLTENERAVIDLAYFEGYSQTEMAFKLGCPLGTVKTWVRSALKTLRGELRVCG
jgi:RNA polymerase sigma-70 factor (ECF subfamily)